MNKAILLVLLCVALLSATLCAKKEMKKKFVFSIFHFKNLKFFSPKSKFLNSVVCIDMNKLMKLLKGSKPEKKNTLQSVISLCKENCHSDALNLKNICIQSDCSTGSKSFKKTCKARCNMEYLKADRECENPRQCGMSPMRF